ncbi:MAG: SDR family oxidoreductase [Thermotogaceae bacterium]|nr:SDR family oxidoreductase [Thermotogaceae bacterium]
MRAVVTGAAGYIGSVLCHMLLDRGYEVIGIDKMLHGGRSILGILNHSRFKLISEDIHETSTYSKYINSETVVVNLAAIVGEPASRKYPEETKRTNLDATKKLIDLSAEKNVKKFIFVSTCSNYGKVEPGEFANEGHELNPLSLYAETKVEMEHYLKETIGTNLNWTVLRFSTVFGLSPRPRFDLTVNDFTLHAITDKKLVIFLPYSNRPYVHVRDAARAVGLVLEKFEKTAGETYNVGSNDQNYRKIDIVNEVKKVVPDFEIEFVEKGNDPRDYRVSFDKIKNQLGYSTTLNILDGIKEIAWAINTGIIKDCKNPEYYNA